MIIDMRAIDEKLRQFEFDCPTILDLWSQLSQEIEDEYDTRVDNMVDWCKENCKGRSMYMQNLKFIFELKSDAMAFKLMWG